MESRIQHVKRRFDNTELYLGKDFNISLRSLVVRDLLGSVKNCNLLDLGCGDGSLSLQFVEEANHIALVDISAAMLEVAKQKTPPWLRTKVDFVNTNLADYAPKDLFDIVLCIGVLAHVASVEDTVAQVSELMKPGGRCILQITDNGRIFGRILSFYSKLRTILSYGYALNQTTSAQLVRLSSRNRLALHGEHHYLSPFPGMGRMPNRWLFNYQLFTLHNPFFSRLGSESILLFSKQGHDGAKSKS
jgi:2-polyprenyl-3-methyl-5-hydroxy-6-metoxy-1,4-benzoquinol methylase